MPTAREISLARQKKLKEEQEAARRLGAASQAANRNPFSVLAEPGPQNPTPGELLETVAALGRRGPDALRSFGAVFGGEEPVAPRVAAPTSLPTRAAARAPRAPSRPAPRSFSASVGRPSGADIFGQIGQGIADAGAADPFGIRSLWRAGTGTGPPIAKTPGGQAVGEMAKGLQAGSIVDNALDRVITGGYNSMVDFASRAAGYTPPKREYAPILDLGGPKPGSAAAAKAKPKKKGPGPGEVFWGGQQAGKPIDPIDAVWPHLLKQEWGQRPDGSFRRSPAGAWGPAQLMPGTAPEAMALAGFDRNDQRWKTDAKINEAAGKAYLRQQFKTFGNLPMALAAYNGGPGRMQQALAAGGQSAWLKNMRPETQGYVQTIMGNLGAGGALAGQIPTAPNPFNAAAPFWQDALSEHDKAFAAGMTPSDIFMEMPDVEMPPAPEELPKRDWTQTDALLEKLRPALIGEAEIKRTRRASLFAGMAQGLMASPEGAGLGTVLAGIGAGMMAGRAAGMEKEQALIDKYDEKMAAFNVVTFQYGRDKADAQHVEAVNAATQTYQYNLLKWKTKQEDIAKYTTFGQQGNDIIMTTREKGGVRYRRMPVGPLWEAAKGASRASIMTQMAGAVQDGAKIDASMTGQIMASMFGANYARAQGQAGSDEGLEGFMGETYMQAFEVVQSGIGPLLFGPEKYEEVYQAAKAQAMAEPYVEGDENFTDRVNKIVVGSIATRAGNDTAFASRLTEFGPRLWRERQLRIREEMRRTRKTDWRGRTTETSQYGYGD